MMKKTTALALLVVFMASASAPAFARNDDDDFGDLRGVHKLNEWELIKRDSLRGITTYGKQEDGKRIRSFKGDVILEASLETVARVQFDIENIKKWYYETRDARLLKKVSNTEFYYTLRYNAPATLPDRDVVLHAVIEPYTPKKGYMLLRLNSVPDFMPVQPGLVRVVAQDMVIKFTPQGPNKTLLEVEGYVDPGGIAPTWAINFVQRRAPYVTLLGMTRMVQLPEYRQQNNAMAFTFVQYAGDHNN